MLSWAKHLLAVRMMTSQRKKRAQVNVLANNQKEDFLVVVECWGVHLPAEDAGFKSDGVRVVWYGIICQAYCRTPP